MAASSSFTAQAVAFASDTQDVHNQQTYNKQQCGCKIIERIPPGHGLMIMLNDENSSSIPKTLEEAATISSCSFCSDLINYIEKEKTNCYICK